MVTVRQAPKYYYLELLGAMALYIPGILFRHTFVAAHPEPSTLKTVVLMSPLLPTLLMALAI